MKRLTTSLFAGLASIWILFLPEFAPAQSIDEYFAASLSTDKQECYAGEVFNVFLTVDSHTLVVGQDFNLDPIRPAEIRRISEEFVQYPIERKLEDGRIHEIRKFSWQASSSVTGTFDLATSLGLSIIVRKPNLFFSSQEKQSYKVNVRGATLTVKPLPDLGRPLDFSGAVGTFTMSATVSPEKAAPGDVVCIRTEIRGTGILENVKAPQMTLTPAVKLYEPKIVSYSPALISEQQAIPLTTNGLILPKIGFSFFDPAAAAYRSLNAGPFQLALRDQTVLRDEVFQPGEISEKTRQVEQAAPDPLRPAYISLIIILVMIAASIAVRILGGVKIPIVLSLILFGLLLLNAGYIAMYKTGYFTRNMYTVKVRQHGMMAPSSQSVLSCEIPAGSLVEFITCANGWVLVRHVDMQCWLPESILSKPDNLSPR